MYHLFIYDGVDWTYAGHVQPEFVHGLMQVFEYLGYDADYVGW